MSPLPKSLELPPPEVPNAIISFPSPHILLVTLNRPKQLNSIPPAGHIALDALFRWYDEEPSLRCAILTGAGRAFCAGADLKDWNERNNAQGGESQQQKAAKRKSQLWMSSGFGGLSNRAGKKPFICAVNGLCLGGGMEIAINADLVVASADAKFGLPEVTIGVVALAGALPRIIRSVGKQRASEMVLLGKHFSADEMLSWGLVNEVVPRGGDVVAAAVKMAERVAGNSPDSIITSREGMRLGWEGVNPEVGTDMLESGLYGRMNGAENMKEGVLSFVERRKPSWKDSKL